MPASQQVHITTFSHESVEWYTPPEYLDAVRKVLGKIDLDPAGCHVAQEHVRADIYYDRNGLEREWFGKCFVNPPYSKTGGKSNQALWSQKLESEFECGNVSEAILLVRSALGYKWFEALWDKWPVCFVRNRIHFLDSNGNSHGAAKQGAAFFYFGRGVTRFTSVFTRFGRIVLPELVFQMFKDGDAVEWKSQSVETLRRVARRQE